MFLPVNLVTAPLSFQSKKMDFFSLQLKWQFWHKSFKKFEKLHIIFMKQLFERSRKSHSTHGNVTWPVPSIQMYDIK